jgi:hypothetical protein
MALGTTGTVVVAALVAGAAGAGAVLVLGPAAPASRDPGGDPARAAALEERVARQDREIASLRARLEEMSHARPAAAAPASPAAGSGFVQVEDFEGSITGAAAEAAAPDAAAPDPATLAALSPEERAKFEAVYAALREKEQAEARRRRLAAVETALRARLDALPAALALTDAQKDEVVRIYGDRGERIRQAYADARTAGSPDALREAQEKVTGIRKDSQAALEQALTVDQARAVERIVDRGGPGRVGGFGSGAGVRRGGRGGAGGGDGGTTPPR